ncbi:hypothetical protein RIF29_15258 [Crotalaria pallida]|uniref:Uncharacterized protein n=1 Tax=Crotalaria pallida TaxID=3830 RepID=A0AAN9IDF7_CROPI
MLGTWRPRCLDVGARGGSLTAEVCGDSSLLEDEELDDAGTSNEVVESRFVSVESPEFATESVAEDDLSS